MSSKDNYETVSGFQLDDVRAGLQVVCDAHGFTLVEDVEYEKCNGKYVSAMFNISIKHKDTTLKIYSHNGDDILHASFRTWVNMGGDLFSDDVTEHMSAEKSYVDHMCDRMLASLLGNAIGDIDIGEFEIPMATSSSELKLKLELMS